MRGQRWTRALPWVVPDLEQSPEEGGGGLADGACLRCPGSSGIASAALGPRASLPSCGGNPELPEDAGKRAADLGGAGPGGGRGFVARGQCGGRGRGRSCDRGGAKGGLGGAGPGRGAGLREVSNLRPRGQAEPPSTSSPELASATAPAAPSCLAPAAAFPGLLWRVVEGAQRGRCERAPSEAGSDPRSSSLPAASDLTYMTDAW